MISLIFTKMRYLSKFPQKQSLGGEKITDIFFNLTVNFLRGG